MENEQDRIIKLHEQLGEIIESQKHFNNRIDALQVEINRLKISQKSESVEQSESDEITTQLAIEDLSSVSVSNVTKVKPPMRQQPFIEESTKKTTFDKTKFEKFIGENLINKIGIVVIIIGVSIGIKYSIDNDLISPMTRIISSYLVGVVLMIFGIRLKAKYTEFSAVLISGAMAIMYFTTFAAYSFYNLIPQLPAFGLMVIFTVFMVIAALNYNLQVVALIGLVGAYAVPFLLSDEAGDVRILFAYTAIINIGILFIAFKNYWKILYYTAFVLTWAMFTMWFFDDFDLAEHFTISLFFLTVFFMTFYTIFLAYKIGHKEKFRIDDIGLLMANSFLFYGIGYMVIQQHDTGMHLLGAFTLANAIIHFIVSTIIFRQKLVDTNILYFVLGLVLIFITISIPVQLDGNWVTLLWAGEALLLFAIGRIKNLPLYEKASYPLMIFAFMSLAQDWDTEYHSYVKGQAETRITPLLNIQFLTSILFTGAFLLINYIKNLNAYPAPLHLNKTFWRPMNFIIPSILLVSLYYTFQLEISNYWNQLYIDSELSINSDGSLSNNFIHDNNLASYQRIWILNFSLLFLSLVGLFNIYKLKNPLLGNINILVIILASAVFLIIGFEDFNLLRHSYVHQTLSENYARGPFALWIRYLSMPFLAFLMWTFYRYIQSDFIADTYRVLFDIVLHITILGILSYELQTLYLLFGSSQSPEIGLSILWGVYALFLIGLGIWKNKRHLRISALVLFAITLLKLFIFDVSHLDTLPKTILFVALGILLLIISFLYNKYKHVISDE